MNMKYYLGKIRKKSKKNKEVVIEALFNDYFDSAILINTIPIWL